MKFEQPANLNRYIQPSVPFTWDLRWRLFKLFMPVLIFLALVFFQTDLLKAWATGDWDAGPFIGVLISWSLIVFSVEISVWLKLKHKRTLRLEKDYVRIGSGLLQRVRWQQIIAWHFHNLTDLKGYQAAGIEYKLGKKSHNYRMVLPRSEINQLVSELKSRQTTNGSPFSIIDHDSDFPSRLVEFKRRRSTNLYLRLLGVFLLYEGFLLLLCANSPSNGILARFIRSHVSSEPGHFALVIGGILCGSGIFLLVWSAALGKKNGSVRDQKKTSGAE